MWLVIAALRRPVTVLVGVLALALASWLAIRRMPADIFPNVGSPVIYVAQPYGGMDPGQMEGYLTYYYEYHFLYITGIEHVESKSIQGAAIMKLVFHEGTDMSQAMAETVGYVNRARAFMPPGTVPPFITRFDAGSIAVAQLVFSSDIRTPGEMQDFALNRVRPLFATLPGVSAPPPFGGNQRAIVVRLNPDRLREYRVSPEEAISAVSRASAVLPAGVVRIGDQAKIAKTNAVIGGDLNELMNAPVRTGNGPTVYVRDLGVVENGTDVLTAYAHVNGKRTVYIPVTKRADASTLDVMRRVRSALPAMQKVLPEDVKLTVEFDQTGFVRSALTGLVSEGALGALLTGLMVLLFLRDWRSALIVMATIPFALLGAAAGLWAAGQSINIMTLAGLALAVGVLVDEATVVIENIHAEAVTGSSRARAVVDASRNTAAPRLLAMMSLLAVFFPAYFMTGVARQLFVPLALAVAFAMVASYLLSCTLVPVLAIRLLHAKHTGARHGRIHTLYTRYVGWMVRFRWPVLASYVLAATAILFLLAPRVGKELFPKAEAGEIQIRMRAPAGTRVERTEIDALKMLDVVKRVAGPENVVVSTAFIGVQPPSYPINLIHLWTSGPQEAVLRVALTPAARARGEELRDKLREELTRALPDCRFSLEAGDIVSQVMNLGSATPIEVAVQGPDMKANRAFAAKVNAELVKIPQLRDLQMAQPLDYPTLDVEIDRDRAAQFGLSASSVARSMVAATSSSRFTEPNFWRDPASGNGFQIQVEIPQHRIQSREDVMDLPLMRDGSERPLLGDVASVKNGTAAGMVERYNMQRVVSYTANIREAPLGEIALKVRESIAAAGEPPRGVTVSLRGQVPAFEQTLNGLSTGLLISIAAIFLLLAAYFQSFRLSSTVLLTMPAVVCGVMIALWFTGTTLNIQSFIGSIMAVGISVANSILLITFAERARAAGEPAAAAAVTAAGGRVRAILMTAAAMIAGMIPLALGLREGGEGTSALGIAVIGGLAAATVSTLSVLPGIYATVQQGAAVGSPSLDPDDPESRVEGGAKA
jgi:multidrug efflux pump subunit AcrB